MELRLLGQRTKLLAREESLLGKLEWSPEESAELSAERDRLEEELARLRSDLVLLERGKA